MKLEAQLYRASGYKHRFQWGFPWLPVVDGAGLFFATWFAGQQLQGPRGQLFVFVLAAFGIAAWLFTSQFKSLTTILTKRNYRVLFAPVFAASSALLVHALTRSYYSNRSLLLFVVVWTLWMFIGRLFHDRYVPWTKIMVFGSPSFLDELRRLPHVTVARLETPPDTFGGFDVVALDPTEVYDRDWLRWLLHADMAGVRILAAPLVIETLTGRVPVEVLNGRWAHGILSRRTGYAFWKRVLDVAFVLLALPVLLPLVCVIALVVYLDGGRPVLFWQERVGKNGRPFKMVKFRSMRCDAERQGAAFASCGDPRITRVGAFLRKFRLDEIPQFWNVLRGDMSIIGPRPEQSVFASHFASKIPLYELRNNLRPGITGWAQVMQGYTSRTEETYEKLRYDFYYVKHLSFMLDMQIALRTVYTVMTGFGSR